ncbi:MAG: ABC transporter permease [Actinomycetota bacterium]
MLITLVRSQLRTFVRDRPAFVLALVMPSFMAIFFGFIINTDAKPLKLGVVQLVGSETSEAITTALEDTKQIRVIRLKTESEARARIEDGAIGSALLIPDVSKPATLTILYDEKSIENLQRAAGAVDAFLQRYNLQLAGAEETLKLKVQGLRADSRLGSYDSVLPFILIFGVLMTAMGGLATRIVTQREAGIFKRLSATPLKPMDYLLSEVIARLFIALLQIAIVLGIGIFAYDATVAGNVGWIFLMAVIATLAFAGIGVVVASLSPSPEAVGGVTGGLTVLMVILGGPTTEIFPAAVKKIAEFLPMGPVQSGIRHVILDGTSPFGLDVSTLVLALWTILPVLLAARLFHFSPPLKSSRGARGT